MATELLRPVGSPSQLLAIWIAEEQTALEHAHRLVACGEIRLSEEWLKAAARSRVQAELWAQAA
jgi:hypothetical protein